MKIYLYRSQSGSLLRSYLGHEAGSNRQYVQTFDLIKGHFLKENGQFWVISGSSRLWNLQIERTTPKVNDFLKRSIAKVDGLHKLKSAFIWTKVSVGDESERSLFVIIIYKIQ